MCIHTRYIIKYTVAIIILNCFFVKSVRINKLNFFHYSFSCTLLFLLHNCVSDVCYFPSLKNAFNISFKGRSAGVKLCVCVCVCCLRNLISLLVLKYNFTGYRFLANDVFSFQHFQCFTSLCLPAWFLRRQMKFLCLLLYRQAFFCLFVCFVFTFGKLFHHF